jgi:hypothetical protein
MDCSDFRDRFSDYIDGTADPSFVEEADAHLAGCESCVRYRDVVARGSGLLRRMAPVSVSDDFLPRLQHRIYHIEDSAALAQASAGSGTTVAAALGIAAVIAAAAWAPALMHPPEVALPPVVVSHPEPRVVGLRPPHLWSGVDVGPRVFASNLDEPGAFVATMDLGPAVFISSVEFSASTIEASVTRGLWDDPRVFVRYSPLATAHETRSIEQPVLIHTVGSPR